VHSDIPRKDQVDKLPFWPCTKFKMKNQLSLPSCLLVLGCIITVSSVFGQNEDNAKIPSNEEKMKNLDALNERNGMKAGIDDFDVGHIELEEDMDLDKQLLAMKEIMTKAMPMLRCMKADLDGPCVPVGTQDLQNGCEERIMDNLEVLYITGILNKCSKDCCEELSMNFDSDMK